MTLLVDTRLVVVADGEKGLSSAQSRRLRKATPASPVLVSDISLWEIATLASLGRIELTIPLRQWLERAVARRLSVPLGDLPIQSRPSAA